MYAELVGSLLIYQKHAMWDHLQLCFIDHRYDREVSDGIFLLLAILQDPFPAPETDDRNNPHIQYVMTLSKYGIRTHWFSTQFRTWKVNAIVAE